MTEHQTNELNSRVKTINAIALRIEEDAGNPDAAADAVEKVFEIDAKVEHQKKVRETVLSFVHSYRNKPETMPAAAWLELEFAKYPTLWSDADERKSTALVIVERIQRFEEEKKKLADYREQGLSRENYLRSSIEAGAKAYGINNIGQYAAEIDHAIEQANEENIKLMYRADGGINQSWHLDGFIAEQHHVESFNLDAAAQGSSYRAEVLKPAPGETYSKNSVDIVIKDGSGKVVRRYQSKYGSNAESTKELFEKGDYRGQRKLVPEGQGKDIKSSTEVIEHDGIKSKPLSKAEAKERQRKIQEERDAKQYEWNEVNRNAIVKSIGQKAAVSAALAIGFQGARIVGRRIWNSLSGKINNSIEEDAAEFAENALKSGVSTGLTVAITGGLVVAIKNGWLGKVLERTPAGQIANMVCLGIENAKILIDLANGKISGPEAVDRAGDATYSLIGSLALGAKGAAYGMAIGAALGPPGIFIGGLVGGVAGGIAGSEIGQLYWKGQKLFTQTMKDTARALFSGAKSTVASFGKLFS